MFNLVDLATKSLKKQNLSLLPCSQNLVIISRSISMNNNLHLTYVFELLNYMQQLFIDVTCIDHLEKYYRFSLMYTFLCLIPKTTLFLELNTKMYLETTTPTAAYTYFAAIAAEREIYDLFGIIFVNHPDLRRILTDYSFVGHPLRKDYPLTGVSELKFSTAKKRIVASLIVLPQEYRDMQYSISWVNLD